MANVNLWGFNVIRAPEQDQARLISLNPGVLVVIGDLQLALRFKRALPDCEVIYRHYPDDRIWTKMTPQRYFDEHSRYSVDGVVVQVGNEDDLDNLEPYVRWTVDLLRLARSGGARFGVMPFSVGRPPNHEQDYKRLLPVFQEMAAQPGKHLWLPHEYFDRRVADQPGHEYIIGRFMRAWRACDEAGLPRPKTIIGEFGPAAGMNPLKGWKDAGVDSNALIEQMRAAAQRWYAANGVAVALFAWKPYRPFESFDLSTEEQILTEIGRHSFVIQKDDVIAAKPVEYPAIPAADDPRWQRCLVIHTYVNLRSEPRIAENITGATQKDEMVFVADGVSLPEGDKEWRVIRKLDGTVGWSRRPPLEFIPQPEAVVTEELAVVHDVPLDVEQPEILPDAAALEEKIRLHLRQAELFVEAAQKERDMAESSRKQAERFEEAAVNERKQAQLFQEMLARLIHR